MPKVDDPMLSLFSLLILFLVPLSIYADQIDQTDHISSTYQSYTLSNYLPKLKITYQYQHHQDQFNQINFQQYNTQEEHLILVLLQSEITPQLDPYLLYQQLSQHFQYQTLVEQQNPNLNIYLGLNDLNHDFELDQQQLITQNLDTQQIKPINTNSNPQHIYHQILILQNTNITKRSNLSKLGLYLELKKQEMLYQLSMQSRK